jgi:hypothetical protein
MYCFIILQNLVFDFPVFHPLVDPTTGELDVKRAFPKWRLVDFNINGKHCTR